MESGRPKATDLKNPPMHCQCWGELHTRSAPRVQLSIEYLSSNLLSIPLATPKGSRNAEQPVLFRADSGYK